jgi:F420-non-reducing hydrogenase large subunit
MPRITTRIYGVTPPPAALKLRELLYDGFYAGDHTTHFHALGAGLRRRPYSYLKYPYLKKVGWKGLVDGADSGVYRATPLAQAEYERLYETLTGDRSGRKPVHATLAIHWARVVELVFGPSFDYYEDPDNDRTR